MGALWTWALRLVGLGGVVHETVGTSFDRPGLLMLFALMMGLADQIERRQR